LPLVRRNRPPADAQADRGDTGGTVGPVSTGFSNSRAAAIKQGYTTGARDIATRSVTGLARTRVTPNALTAAGVTLCALASAIVLLEDRNHILFYWLAAAVFVAGSVLDILDGALARAGGKTTRFGAYLDSTTDRVSEGFMLTALAYVLARDHHPIFVAVVMAAVAGSFLVSYTRAKAEALGLRGDVGIGSRAERVVVITAGLVLAPWGVLPWALVLLACTAWITVVQRVLHVRTQLMEAEQ
jgi:CDP-diacylglycerol--glycerol-3-phosphate 3-phosphatidyltransferase